MAEQATEPQITYTFGESLYVNLTDGCSLKCGFCCKRNPVGPRIADYDLTLGKQPSAKEVRRALGDLAGYSEVVFCGFGEPTLRLATLLEIAEHVKRKGLPVRVNTDGLANRVFRRDITPQFAGRVDSLSVSLNAADAETYHRICQPPWPDAFDYLLDFLRKAPEHVPEVTATAVSDVPGVDVEACRRLAEADLNLPFRARPHEPTA